MNRKIQPIENAVEGLEAIRNAEFPLILFNSPTPVGELPLPEGIYVGDWVSTDCHVIKRINEVRPKTPLIVTHLSYFPGYELNFAIKKYKDAGTTHLFDWSVKILLRNFQIS